MTSKEVIHASAELRGKGKFRDAIDLVSSSLDGFDPDILMNAYHEMFLAAKEAGFKDEALQYAKKVLEQEPDFPTAKSFVQQHAV